MVEHARGHAALVTQLLSQGNYTSANIVFPALFMTIRVHLSSVAAVFLCAVPQPVVCGSRAGLPSQKEAVRHVPGLCGQWFGQMPDSQMAKVSLVMVLSLTILFWSLTIGPFLYFPSFPSTAQPPTCL